MKKNILTILIIGCIAVAGLQAQVLISDDVTQTPDGSSALEIRSTEAGILIPRMSAAERDAITNPARGLMVFVGDDSQFYYYNGSSWQTFGGADDDWVISGDKIYREVSGNTLVTIDNNVPVMEVSGHISQTGTGGSVFLGKEAGYHDNLNDNENVFVGYQAGYTNNQGHLNVALGYQALYNNNLGGNNTATGHQALYNNTNGLRNSAFGYKVLYSNTAGNDNVANGFKTLYYNTTGSFNVAIGSKALFGNQWSSSGNNNVAIGNEVLQGNSSGSYNIALGYQALYNNNWGNKNVAFGYQALFNNQGGINNIAIGDSALLNNTSGHRNTALGHRAFVGGNNYTNSTALGYEANITANNQVRIGNKDVTSIGGYANWTDLSDGRFKKEIRENVAGLEFILKLRPVTFHLDMEALAEFLHIPDSLRYRKSEKAKEMETQVGFIAQEVEKTAAEIGFDFHGVDKPKNKDDYYGLRYAEFVAPLVKAVQEQQKLLDQQMQMILELKKEVEELQKTR